MRMMNGSAREISAPSQTQHGAVVGFAGLYSALFVVGLSGNVVLLTTALCIPECRFVFRSWRVGNLGLQLVLLSLCDVVATLSLPSTILDLLLGQWILGQTMCSAHWAAESLGKVAGSTGVLSLALEASFCVRGWRRFRWARLVLTNAAGFFLSVLFILPNIYYAAETPEPPQFIPDPYPDGRDKAELIGPKLFLGTTTPAPTPRSGTEVVKIATYTVYKCLLEDGGSGVLEGFSAVNWVSVNVGAGLAVGGLWAEAAVRLRHSRQHRLRPIVRGVGLLALFHWSVWLPHWAILRTLSSQGQSGLVFLIYAAHSLPFVSAALSWPLYLLNFRRLVAHLDHIRQGFER